MTREPTIADEMVGHWHKVAAALMHRAGKTDVRLGVADFEPIDGLCVVASHENGGATLRLRLMPQAEAERLAEEFQRSARRKN